MGSHDLLQHLRAAGLTIRLLDGDRLHVAPRGLITPELGQTIREGKAALLAALRAEDEALFIFRGGNSHEPCPQSPQSPCDGELDPSAAPDDLHELARELLDERAAIMEFDGGLTRPAAEAAASAMLPGMLAALAPAAALSKWLPPADDAELDRMAARERLALGLGLAPIEAERLADRLHLRDRQQTGMTFCCECAHLFGKPSRWRCSSLAGLPGALVGEFIHRQPQRCPGFDSNPAWPASSPGNAVSSLAAEELAL